MKKTGLFLILLVFFCACDNTEDSSPELQANMEGVLFKALDARAFTNKEGKFIIEGTTQNQRLSIELTGNTEGNYIIAGDSINIARFKDASGNLYSSEFGGKGTISISNFDIENNSVSGIFNFETILRDLDTLTFNNGIFFEAPIIPLTEETVIDNSTFAASIDGKLFTQPTLSINNENELITIMANRNAQTIKIIFDKNISKGEYMLGLNGFAAIYIEDNIDETALKGNLSIISNDIAAKKVKANFAFDTENTSIKSGQFTVTYN